MNPSGRAVLGSGLDGQDRSTKLWRWSVKTKSGNLSEGVPSSAELNQSQSYEVSPTSKLGEVTIDPNQQRSVRNLLSHSQDADSLSTGKGE